MVQWRCRHEPVKEHFEPGEVLFDGGLGLLLAEELDVGGDVKRLDGGEGEALGMAPREEGGGIAEIGFPRIGITDLIGKEGEKGLGGLLPAACRT